MSGDLITGHFYFSRYFSDSVIFTFNYLRAIFMNSK